MSRDIPAAILRLSPYTTVTRVAIVPGGRWKVHAMALSWEPDPGSLQQIMILLKESQSSDTKTQQDLKPVSLARTQTRHVRVY